MLAAALLLVPGGLAAERPRATAESEPHGVLRIAPRAGDGAGRAPRFTAELSANGIAVLTPDGGSLWSWRLVAVEAGGEPVAGVDAGLVAPIGRGAGEVEYPRGAVAERYLARHSTVEQRFVLREPLALGGEDLAIVGAVESPGRFVGVGDGWRWGEGPDAVRLGDVRVFDAQGVNLPARLEVTATATRLTVTSDGLARAAYPVTIDPEIGTDDFRISDMGPEGSPLYATAWVRLAYNSTRDEVLVVWEGNDVMEDGDEIYGQRLEAPTGLEIGDNDFRVSDMGPPGDSRFQADLPAVAYNSRDDEYLVVWQGDEGTDGEIEIYGQRLDAATGAEVGEDDLRISTMGPDGDNSFQAHTPDVIYNPTAREYLVVWTGNEESGLGNREIYVQRLDAATGAELGENDLRITDVYDDAEHPAVAYDLANDQYLVVFDARKFFLSLHEDVFGQRLDGATATEIGADDFRISDMGPEDAGTSVGGFRPDVLYDLAHGEFLVVWNGIDEEIFHGNGEAEVYGQRLDAATGAQVGANDFRLSSMGPDGDTHLDAARPQAVYSAGASEVLVVWDGEDQINGDGEVYGQRYAPGLFEDDFEDEEISGDWSLPRGAWTEDLGVLAGAPGATGRPVGGLATGFAGCGICTVTAELTVRSLAGAPATPIAWLTAWSQGLSTSVLVVLDPDRDRVLLAQREDGAIVATAWASAAIDPDVPYRLEVAYDGARFRLLLDGEELLDVPRALAGAPFGTVGFGARGAEVEVQGIAVVEGDGG